MRVSLADLEWLKSQRIAWEELTSERPIASPPPAPPVVIVIVEQQQQAPPVALGRVLGCVLGLLYLLWRVLS